MSRPRTETEIIVSLWPILRRYHWRFILPAFAVAAAVLVVSIFLPHTYRGEAAFERRTDMVLSEMTSRGASTNFQDPRVVISEELIGPSAINRLLDQFYDPKHPINPTLVKAGIDRETLRNSMQRRLLISTDIASTDVDRYRVRYTGPNPEVCRAVVNGLVNNYLEQARERMDKRLRQSTEFFRTEVERSRKLIDQVENRKLEFEIKNANLLPQTISAIPVYGLDLKSQLLNLTQQRDQASLQLESLRKSLESTPTTTPTQVTGRNPERIDAEQRIRQVESQLANYLGALKMTERHPDVQALRQQLVDLRAQIVNLPEEVVTQKHVSMNPRRSELETLVAKTSAEYESLSRQVDALDRRIRDEENMENRRSTELYPVRTEYLRVSRELAEAHRQLTFWEDNLRRVELSVAAETGNRGVQFNFTMPCPRLTRLESPRLQQALVAAVLLGLTAGALNVYLAYRNDVVCRHPQDLAEGVNLPLYGCVSEIISEANVAVR
ncbi:MAG: hypothetical protein HC898_03425 [Phycisphaerales bacterium]|nr:hypothetical protein [Phycisphaerales bacterium]